MDRFTVLPFLVAMFVAVAGMPTNVFQVCYGQMGIEHDQPWRSRVEQGIRRVGHALLARVTAFCARWRCHPLAVPIAMAVVLLIASAMLSTDAGVVLANVGTISAASQLKALRQQASDIRTRTLALNQKVADGTDLSQEERDELKRLGARAADVAAALTIAEQANEVERNAPDPEADPDVEASRRAAARVQVGQDWSESDPKRGFTHVADFARAVRNVCIPGGRVDPRLAAMLRPLAAAPSNPHTEAGNTEGYEVPAAFSADIFQLVFDQDDLLSAMNPEPTDSNAVDIEGDETTPWGASGVQARWRAEGAAMTGTKTVTNLRTVRLHELYAFISANEELLSDSPRLQNRLTVKSADAIRWKAAEAIFAGTGAGQPLGYMKSPALVTVAAEGSQTADTIVAANVLKMLARFIADGGRSFWTIGRDAIPQIATMTIGNQPIWTPPNAGLKDAPGGMLLGLPIRWSEHAAATGDLGDISLVNPVGYYAAIKRGGVQFASSIHLYFDYNATAFRWTFRLGGQPYLSAPVTAAKQSSKSHFVTLAAR